MPTIFQTNNPAAADYKVCVSSAEEADLWVYLAPIPGMLSGPGCWFMTQLPTKTNIKLYFTNSQTLADLKVHFVTNSASAGWRRAHPLSGRFQ